MNSQNQSDQGIRQSGELVIKALAMPRDTNPNGDIFGGWLVSQMDLGAAILASRIAAGRVVTVAIDSMSFICPVHVGDTISFYAQLMHIGNTSMNIKIEAWRDQANRLCADQVTQGIFTFVAIDANGKARPVKAAQ